MSTDSYYKKFENRRPYQPQSLSPVRILIFRFFSILFLAIGIQYLSWRWVYSLNPDALWFSIPLALAESFMFLSSVIMIVNYWNPADRPVQPPVHLRSEIDGTVRSDEDRPLSIDLLIATYNEELSIVEDTLRDAKKLHYPFRDVKIHIYLCDDGRRDGRDPERENFKALADRYGIRYFTRETNRGFKAGNLNHAFWQTDGDLLVILDADTRVFSDFLENLTGYFRDEKMAWVQSPQWFYDIPEGTTLHRLLAGCLPKIGSFMSRVFPFAAAIRFGKNIFGTDPQVFYDSILRHRNASNAAFCCGAGSVHRRKALEELVQNQSRRLLELDSWLMIGKGKNTKKVVGPFVHHISEDIYTSVLLHAENRRWKSYQHPNVESRMLSPQSLQEYAKQYSRYAEGAFDLFFSRDNPLIKKGLRLRQRIAYLETLYSYFTPVWVLIFIFSPIVFFFTLTPPIKAFNFDFFLRFIGFMTLNVLVSTIANWGISTKRSEQYFVAGIWIKLKALFKVLLRKKMQFNPTAKLIRKTNRWANLKPILPHLAVTLLTGAGFIYNIYLVQKKLHPSYASFFANSVWAFYNMYQINPMIRAAFKSAP